MDQLGVQAAVNGVADVFNHQAVQQGTDRGAGLGQVYAEGGIKRVCPGRNRRKLRRVWLGGLRKAHVVHFAADIIYGASVVLAAPDLSMPYGLPGGCVGLGLLQNAVDIQRDRLGGGIMDADEIVPDARLRGNCRRRKRPALRLIGRQHRKRERAGRPELQKEAAHPAAVNADECLVAADLFQLNPGADREASARVYHRLRHIQAAVTVQLKRVCAVGGTLDPRRVPCQRSGVRCKLPGRGLCRSRERQSSNNRH